MDYWIDCNLYKHYKEYYQFNLTSQRSDTWTMIPGISRWLDEAGKKEHSSPNDVEFSSFPWKIECLHRYWLFARNIEMVARNSANEIQLSEKCIANVVMRGRDQT